MEAFAEADAVLDEFGAVDVGRDGVMSEAHFRPEFADAAGDAVSVVVEFGVGLEGDDVRGAGLSEALEV